MSRIGEAPIKIPTGVTVTIAGSKVSVAGPKGTLEMDVLKGIEVSIEAEQVIVKRQGSDQADRAIHGLTRALINNLVVGVSMGWSKNLEMVGVGYRAVGGGNSLTLSVGFSHPVTVQAPPGIEFAVLENTKISVSGIDRILVGQIAANIRAVKPPEPYKGKGIRYVGEYVRRKAGKAGKAATGATK